MLFTVYDLKGDTYEVAPHIAKYLIIEEGWTISPPKEIVNEIEENEEPEVPVNSALK